MPTLRHAIVAAVASAALLCPASASARDFFITARSDIATTLRSASGGDRIFLSDDDGTFAHVDTSTSFGTDVVVQPRTGEQPTTEGWRFQSGASHVVLRGLTIREPNYTAVDGGSAVQVDDGASDIAIEDCRLTEGRHGLRIVGDDDTSPSNITLRDSEITGDGTSDGIQVDAVNVGGGQHIAIDHNLIHDIHIGLPNGRDVQHDDGVQVFLGSDVAITRNTIYLTTPQTAGPNQGIIVGRAQDAYGVGGQDVEDVTIADNLIYQWPGSGITVSGTTDVDVIHNTSYDTGERGGDNALTVSEPLESDGRTRSLNSGLTIANNAIEKLAVATGASNPTTCTTNLVSVFNPRAASSACTSTDTSDPLFDGTYYLQSGSPAIGRANGSYPLPSGLGDRDETTRDAAPDLGAREWHPLTDTLTASSGVLSGHAGEGSLGWSLVTADPGTASLDGGGRLLADTENTIYSYAASWTPSDNTYAVETVVVDREPGSGDFSGPVCRWSASGSKNGYMGRVKDGLVELVKFVGGTSTILASNPLPTHYVGQPLKIGLDCDSTKAVLIDDASLVTSGDDAVTQVGKAGVRGNTQTLPIDTVAAYDS
jgi:hypothetical protein